MKRLLCLIGLVLTMSACGGNSGKASNETSSVISSVAQSSSSVASSIVASSSPSSAISLTCSAGNGVIFADSVCSDWNFKIWEQKSDMTDFSPFLDQAGIILTAQVLDSGDALHGKVYDMNYNGNTLWSSLPQFRAYSANNTDHIGFTNLDNFNLGKISFDIKVLANPDNVNFVARAECGWPCNSRDNSFHIAILNQWTHIELSLSELMAQGLDLQNVDVAFEISPEWGKQMNVHYQLDNIRWEKSIPTSQNCSTAGVVFADSLCAGWRTISYFETTTDHSTPITEVFAETPGSLITQKVIDATDTGHGKVLDISYNNNSVLSGGVRALNPTTPANGVDMSEYQDGLYAFDIKVINIGDSSGDLYASFECGWPCTTDQPIKIKQLNQWQTVVIPVRYLINSGLDIAHVTAGFEVNPEWGHQANWHYQLDNMRWIKTKEVSTRAACFAQYFNTPGFNYSYILNSSITHTDLSSAKNYLGVTAILNPDWNILGTEGIRFLMFDDQLTLTNCLNTGRVKNGTLSAQVYVDDAYLTDGKLKPSFILADSAGETRIKIEFNLSSLKSRQWATLSFDLKNLQTDQNNIRYMGLSFEANGKPASVNGYIRMDNFLIINDQ